MENRTNAQLKDLAFNRKTRNQESGENLSLNGCKLRDLVAETFGYYMAYALYSLDSFLKQMQKGVINVFFVECISTILSCFYLETIMDG